MSKASNNENKETKKLVVEGVVTSARVGSSKFDDTIKKRLSLKCEDHIHKHPKLKQ